MLEYLLVSCILKDCTFDISKLCLITATYGSPERLHFIADKPYLSK